MVMPLFVVSQLQLAQIQPQIHVFHHHVVHKTFAMYTVMLLFVIHALAQTPSTIHHVDQNASQILIVPLTKHALVNRV